MEKSLNSRIAKIINAVRPEIQFVEGQDVELFGLLDSMDIIILVEELEVQLGVIVDAEQIIPENFASLSALEAFVKTLTK